MENTTLNLDFQKYKIVNGIHLTASVTSSNVPISEAMVEVSGQGYSTNYQGEASVNIYQPGQYKVLAFKENYGTSRELTLVIGSDWQISIVNYEK